MSPLPRELALFNAIEANLARLGGDSRARAAYELTVVLFEQCSAYHVALAEIKRLLNDGKSTSEVWNVFDNLDQPL